MKSKYVVFPRPDQVELAEEEIGNAGPDELLCAAERSLISTGTELNCLAGRFDPGTNWESMVRFPFRPGYSMVARVLEVGSAVTGFAPGDRVTCRTPHRQFFSLLAREAHRIPDAISSEEATFTRLAGTTQIGFRRADLKLGETVGVIGLGILGQLVAQYALVAGARFVIAIDASSERLRLARSCGITETLCANADAALAPVRSLTNGRMLDVVFDVTGHPAVLAPALQLLHRLGRLVLLGDTPHPTQQTLGPGVVSNALTILGVHGTTHPDEASDFAPWSRPAMYDLFFDYLCQKRMQVAPLITHRFAAEEAPKAYDLLRSNRTSALGVVLDWGVERL
jgi:2-desacetyl-2-hydroxyethyl bacteriochlorophyllide A dehydrogenase